MSAFVAWGIDTPPFAGPNKRSAKESSSGG